MAQHEGHCPERFELGFADRDLGVGVDFFRTSILRILSSAL
jgi:hypothetical protein